MKSSLPTIISFVFLSISVFCGCEPPANISKTAPSENNGSSFLKHANTSKRFRFERPAMGVLFKTTIYAPDKKAADEAFEAAWPAVIAFDNALSDYKTDSEINRLSRSSPHAQFVPISNVLRQLLTRSLELSATTRGAFDVTVGPISHLWRAAIKRNRLPDQKKIDLSLPSVGTNNLELNEQGVRLLQGGMQLDFGGIAKGAAADALLFALKSSGIEAALVDASGDITVMGTPPEEAYWRIAIGARNSEKTMQLNMGHGAVATSGDAFQALEFQGTRYSHIVDPRTGWAVTHTSMATVIATDGATADALASACCVLPAPEAIALIEALANTEARIVTHRETNIRTDESPNNPNRTSLKTVTQSSGFDGYLAK